MIYYVYFDYDRFIPNVSDIVYIISKYLLKFFFGIILDKCLG